MPALRIMLVVLVVGVHSFNPYGEIEFPKNWDYSNFGTEDVSDSLDADSVVSTKTDASTPVPKKSILDLLNDIHPTETDISLRKQQRLRVYMTELYNNLTSLSVTLDRPDKYPKQGDQHPGNLSDTSIRGMQAYKVSLHWNDSYSIWFNISDVTWNRMPEQAELVMSPRHGKSGPFWRDEVPGPLYERRLKKEEPSSAGWQTMLIRTGRKARPYFVLDVTQEVHSWITDMQNLGSKDDQFPLKLTTFARNVHKPATIVKPFLVLYYGLQHDSLLQEPSEEEDETTKKRRRPKVLKRESRSAVSSSPGTSTIVTNKCSLQDWYVDFEELGWDNWVLAPSGVRLNYCAGECPPILIQSEYRASNHAMLRGIYRSKRPSDTVEGQRIPLACCVPTLLKSANIMYLEDRKIIIRRLDGMVAEECGCQ